MKTIARWASCAVISLAIGYSGTAMAEQSFPRRAPVVSAAQETQYEVMPQRNAQDTELRRLQIQNESLRETIRAQVEMLKSSDPSGDNARRLSDENRRLKSQVDTLSASLQDTRMNARQLFERYEELQAVAVKQKDYIVALRAEAMDGGGFDAPLAPPQQPSTEDMRQDIVRLEQQLQREQGKNQAYLKELSRYKRAEVASPMPQAQSAAPLKCPVAPTQGSLAVALEKLKQENTTLKIRNHAIEMICDVPPI